MGPSEPSQNLPTHDDTGTCVLEDRQKNLVMLQAPGFRDTRNTVGFNSH